jgi:hypothetical protein
VTEGLVGQAPEDVLVVPSVRAAGEVVVDDPDQVSFLSSPAMAAEDAVAELRSRFLGLREQQRPVARRRRAGPPGVGRRGDR